MGFSSLVASGLISKVAKIVQNKAAAGTIPKGTSAVTGANKSVTNRATGMQSKGGPRHQAASGTLGVVSQGMVNAEVQNDDVILPYAKL